VDGVGYVRESVKRTAEHEEGNIKIENRFRS
jgi:hypothetical protein